MPSVAYFLDENCEVKEKGDEANTDELEQLRDYPAEVDEDDDLGLETFDTQVQRTVKCFADQAYRTILICYRDMSMEEYQ